MYCEHISQKYVKARKEHVCSWCGEIIKKGEVHQSRFYKYEGDVRSAREHKECDEAICEAYRDGTLYDDEGYEPGEFKRGSTELKDNFY